MSRVRILQGDCRAVLPTLPADSVHCVVTSPPYWGLRDYGTGTWEGGDVSCSHIEVNPQDREGRETPGGRGGSFPQSHRAYKAVCAKCGARRIDNQLGLEPTYAEFIDKMVEVFREVRRVLRPDGTCWLNLGDSYAGYWGEKYAHKPFGEDRTPDASTPPHKATPPWKTMGVKPKDLVGIPWRVAFALQADGWWLRQDIIWSKPNPMPESVTDRCTKSHEYLFLLTKSARYFYDAEAIKEADSRARSLSSWDERKTHEPTRRSDPGSSGHVNRTDTLASTEGRNKRSVWEIATSPFPEAHFATFPPALVEPCIKAGTSEKGCCAKCGVPWERQSSKPPSQGAWTDHEDDLGKGAGGGCGRLRKQQYLESLKHPRETLGWQPTCTCQAAVIPCTVLDPFGGAGTTALVADRLQRNSIIIELNPTYAEMARKRIFSDAPLFAEAAE